MKNTNIDPNQIINVPMTVLQATILWRLGNMSNGSSEDILNTDMGKYASGLRGDSSGLQDEVRSFLQNGQMYEITRKPLDDVMDDPETVTFDHPIEINGSPVEFKKGSIQVGEIKVSNDVVRRIAEHLKDSPAK